MSWELVGQICVLAVVGRLVIEGTIFERKEYSNDENLS